MHIDQEGGPAACYLSSLVQSLCVFVSCVFMFLFTLFHLHVCKNVHCVMYVLFDHYSVNSTLWR